MRLEGRAALTDASEPDPEAARNNATALASDDARWVMGTALTVDGGSTSGIWR